MIFFDLKASVVKFALKRARRDRIAAIVFGRVLPTIETENGRAAVLPSGAQAWAKRMGLETRFEADTGA